MHRLTIQFDLAEIDITYLEDRILVENNGEPHIYNTEAELNKDLIEEAEYRGYTIFYDVRLSAQHGDVRGGKAFSKYEDALVKYKKVDTDSKEMYSWDHKQINARILH